MEQRPSEPRRRGRPQAAAAIAHDRVIEAVYGFLQERPLRELTMDAVAKRAGVGKPTLYRWWPTRNALLMAMVNERLVLDGDTPSAASAEVKLRRRVERIVAQYSGTFGRIMAELIGEAQADLPFRQELFDRQIGLRRHKTIEEIEQGKANGEFRDDLDAGLLLDAVFGAIYYRLLLGSAPLDPEFGRLLVEQVLRGARRTG